MERHAYLIIANRNFQQLQLLLNLVDDERNDIYLLIDKKAKNKNFDFHTKYSNLIRVPSINIYWGSYSQIQAEIILIRNATQNGPYNFYHLLSGMDLPLANQDVIHNFFDSKIGYNFLSYSHMVSSSDLEKRIYRYHFQKHFRKRNLWFRCFRKLESLQFKMYHQQKIKKDKIAFASNWFSISDSLAHKIVDSNDWIEKTFSDGYLVDELFIPTLIKNSREDYPVFYTNPVHDRAGELQGNLRYIKWWGPGTLPHTWVIDDFDELKEARTLGHLFSRKFDSEVDQQIIDRVIQEIIPMKFSKSL